MNARLTYLFARAVDVRDSELRALLWAFAYFFSLLAAYYVLRPLRDEMGIAGGVRALPWLFTGTFLVMLCAVPVFGAVVARFPRRQFIPYVYGFFVLNLVLFWALFDLGVEKVYVARAFFIWTSVFNLFVVSVFWSFMADIFRNEQGKRLFGFIAAGGTAGTIVGPSITFLLAQPMGPTNLLLVSAALLVFALYCVRRLVRLAGEESSDIRAEADDEAVIGGGMFSGITEVLKSPYLLGICLFLLLYTSLSTLLYFQQANIVRDAFADSATRTQVFALMDIAVSTLTILTQIFVTGRYVKAWGVGAALAFLPVVSVIGFTALALAPTITVLVVFQIFRRASNFAISRPAREILFTVLPREEKYKAKNFIDTVVYRGGDAVSGWLFAGLKTGLGLELATIAGICVPAAIGWWALAWWLGRRQDRLAAQQVPGAAQ